LFTFSFNRQIILKENLRGKKTLMFNPHYLEEIINATEKLPPFPEVVRSVSREIDRMREGNRRDLLHHLDKPAECQKGENPHRAWRIVRMKEGT